MTATIRRWKRRRLLTLVAIIVGVFALPAIAGGNVDCRGGGSLYTQGESIGQQYHWVDPFGHTPNLGAGYNQVYWGYFTGNFDWDVYGTGIISENAVCPA